MDQLLGVVQNINSFLSGILLIVVLVGAGVFFTVKLRFVPL